MTVRRDEALARELDADDPLASYRERFHIPRRDDGRSLVYLCGNSLGLQPRRAAELVNDELRLWAERGVDGHFEGPRPWYSYHECVRDSAARLVGARPHEVVVMNSLTVNLHLMMASFYRPTPQRYKVLMEWPVFPSDTYAVRTQLRYRGFDADEGLVIVRPRDGMHLLESADFEAILERQGKEIAMVLLAGVNFFTGQVLDMPGLTAAARRQGCVVGWDLAHAVGNIPLRLHDWGPDFAVWCSYKYLNSGPGAVGGCFVHERNTSCQNLPRFGGWWGNNPKQRFLMHLLPEFVPVESADGWQLSNPPILALAPVKASLDLFDEIGMDAIRAKSVRLTGYLHELIESAARTNGRSESRYEVITPRAPEARGCQLSILVHDRPKELFSALHARGIVCDFREPNVIRVAPTPLYNSFHDAWTFAQVLGEHAAA